MEISVVGGQGIGGTVGALILQHLKQLGFQTARADSMEGNVASIKNLTRQMGPGQAKDGVVYFEKNISE